MLGRLCFSGGAGSLADLSFVGGASWSSVGGSLSSVRVMAMAGRGCPWVVIVVVRGGSGCRSGGVFAICGWLLSVMEGGIVIVSWVVVVPKIAVDVARPDGMCHVSRLVLAQSVG